MAYIKEWGEAYSLERQAHLHHVRVPNVDGVGSTKVQVLHHQL